MALGKDKGKIIKQGGGILKIREVNDDGTAKDPAGTVYDLGFFQDGKLIGTEENAEDVKDERGVVVKHLDGDLNIKFSCLLLQTGKDEIDFLRDSTGSKTYQAYWKMSKTGDMDGKTQEVFMGLCRISRQFDIQSGVKKIPFEMTLLVNEEAITLTGLTSAYGSAADTATIGAEKFFEVVETTPS